MTELTNLKTLIIEAVNSTNDTELLDLILQLLFIES